jgi:hypothetical protein
MALATLVAGLARATAWQSCHPAVDECEPFADSQKTARTPLADRFGGSYASSPK